MNDNEPRVTLITGRARRTRQGDDQAVHIFVVAPDEDSAVRSALNALSAQGFAQVELEQIGEVEAQPDEEPHASAYQGALEGEVSIVKIRTG